MELKYFKLGKTNEMTEEELVNLSAKNTVIKDQIFQEYKKVQTIINSRITTLQDARIKESAKKKDTQNIKDLNKVKSKPVSIGELFTTKIFTPNKPK